jgi:hypothetical protein
MASTALWFVSVVDDGSITMGQGPIARGHHRFIGVGFPTPYRALYNETVHRHYRLHVLSHLASDKTS